MRYLWITNLWKYKANQKLFLQLNKQKAQQQGRDTQKLLEAQSQSVASFFILPDL